ncbi:MAG: DUF1284 domain-containing protein [Phycisphaerae bacterium]|nr:DUF1284 domain-containing protein [Phycisphaerae bacterium]
MRIRLRPYHPTYVIGFYGAGGMEEGFNRIGFNEVVGKIQDNPNIEVELVEQFDDICVKCERLVEDENGSIWGKQHTCPSAQSDEIVGKVTATNKRILQDLGLQFGSVIKLRDLVKLLSEKLPTLDDEMLGAPEFQEKYAKGLAALSQQWEG